MKSIYDTWRDLAEVQVSIEQLPNGTFRWEVRNKAGEVLATEREDNIANCMEFAGSAMKEVMDEMAERILHPDWFDGSLSDDDEVNIAFTGVSEEVNV